MRRRVIRQVELGLDFGGQPVFIGVVQLQAFGVPEGMAVKPMVQREPGPWVGLIVLDREPNSILADALLTAATDPGMADALGASQEP